MKSSKSTTGAAYYDRYRRHFRILVVNHVQDNRSELEEVVTHNGVKVPCMKVKSLKEIELTEQFRDAQLIIIDGGKGQLSSAVKSLNVLGILDKVTIVGIAKRLEEIFFPGDSIPVYINKKSESLKLIQQARNEAHRFAITFHRNKRSQDFTKTELEDIPGIGEKTAAKLLKHFGSVKKLRDAEREEVEKVIGQSATKKVWVYFGKEGSGGS